MNHHFIPAAALLLLFLAGCSRPKEVTAAAPSAAPSRVTVTVAQASTRTVPASISETGSFVADETSDIAPLVAGRVIATPANLGDFVRAGQVICELDHRDAQLRLDQIRSALEQANAALRQTQSRIGLTGNGQFDPNRVPEVAAAKAAFESAQAQARLASADAKRYENLVATGDVSRSAFEKAHTAQETADAQANAARQQYEAALNTARQNWGAVENSQASLEGARSQLAQAEKGLADTTIRAPFDGYITDRPVAAGEYVALTNKIATIVRLNTMKLHLQTPEQQAARVRAGMPVTARVAAYPDRDFTGKIAAVNPSVDPNSRIFILEARFANPKGELRPGMFSTARILLPGGENAVFVPRTAVIRDKTTDSYQIFAIDNNTARLRVVVTGDPDGDLVRITNGLSGNETVATSNLGSLYDGAPVQLSSVGLPADTPSRQVK
jgi:multidrug efflux pump subunit AcrA (membrane-fusion protein)